MSDPGSILTELIDGAPTTGGSVPCAECYDQSSIQEARVIDFPGSEATNKSKAEKTLAVSGCERDANSAAEDGQTALHVAVCNGHLEMVRTLLERGANANKKDARGWTPKALAQQQGKKGVYDLLLSYDNRGVLNEHKIDFTGSKATDFCTSQSLHTRTGGPNFHNSHFKKVPTNSNSGSSSYPSNKDVKTLTKRVTIHKQFPSASTSQGQFGKLIILPDSVEELLQIAGKLCLTSKKFLKINLIFQHHSKLLVSRNIDRWHCIKKIKWNIA